MPNEPRRALAGRFGSQTPDYGIAICDDCEGEFPVGEYTAQLLSTDPFQPIRCRPCHVKSNPNPTETE